MQQPSSWKLSFGQLPKVYCRQSVLPNSRCSEFRPDFIRVKHLNNLKNEINDHLCTVEVKISDITDEIPVIFEENQFKRVQKMKKNVIIADTTNALELTIWESHFDQIVLGDSYHIRSLKIRIFKDQISLTATADTSFIKIEDLQETVNELDNNINRCHTLQGKIISIEKNNDQFACQGCGGFNMIETANIITCNDCHSRLFKDTSMNDDNLKIMILTLNNQEYNLKIPKSLTINLLNVDRTSSIENTDFFYNENSLNTLLSTDV
ncbi:unnamed protein product [Adineta steineri]|uniref:Uncharacterized protein n=1 Tax=Adineta steineri TaxID=433720 RepID=A0A820A802_9BILA|nr:unnamed protein product [Adineta steineri]CAF4184405.1 unnamed protein product [Adineta steineri]